MTAGRLLLGATPLGQPGDASARLVDGLASADVVAAEDTRRVRTLAQSLDVQLTGRVVSLFDQNEAARVPALVDEIEGRRDGAGGQRCRHAADQRPGLPAGRRPASRQGSPVSCLPGPSAVTTALAVSGLPSDRFCFEGFAPRKHSARRTWLVAFWPPSRAPACSSSRRAGWPTACATPSTARRRAPRGGLPRADQDARGGPPRLAGRARRLGRRRGARRDHRRAGRCGADGRPATTLVAEVDALVDDGMRVKDACAQVVAAHPGAPSRRELYDAVLRARAGRCRSARQRLRDRMIGAALCRHSSHSRVRVGIGGDAAADAQHRVRRRRRTRRCGSRRSARSRRPATPNRRCRSTLRDAVAPTATAVDGHGPSVFR